MAAIMSKEEFLKELTKRKSQLKLLLSKKAEAKSDYEISEFRKSMAVDNYVLDAESRMKALARMQDYRSVVFALVFGQQFPWLTHYGSHANGTETFIPSSDIRYLISSNKSFLESAYSVDYNLFIRNTMRTPSAIEHFESMRRYFDIYKTLQTEEEINRLAMGMWAESIFQGVQATQRATSQDFASLPNLFRNSVLDIDLFTLVYAEWDKLVQSIGPLLYDMSKWFYNVKLADDKVKDAEDEFISFSLNLKAFLETCSQDPNLAGLVPSFEQLLSELENPEKPAEMPPIQTAIPPQAIQGKNTNWLLIAGAAGAALYLLNS